MKKILPIIIFLLVAAGGGYYFYNEQVKVKTPDVVAKDTGKMTLEDMDTTKEEKTSGKEKKETDYDFYEYFESWDDLDEAEQKDGTYSIPKYEEQTLYLMYAVKQNDGKIATGFSDKTE
ncbi:MAG: hypothetical protein ACTJHC_00475 [Vagococcus sp.]